MPSLSEVLLSLNIMLAIGTIISGVVSWIKGGFMRRLVDSVQKIDDIENDVREINDWKNDIEVLMVALSKGDDHVDEKAVIEELELDIGYKEYMVEDRLKSEERRQEDN